ncbi:hypothetical protein SBBP1_530004 [Burkholderiales bacterium]|nr:hypothetical protein SBBP1_530004 [Burkholderiales bacterium]
MARRRAHLVELLSAIRAIDYLIEHAQLERGAAEAEGRPLPRLAGTGHRLQAGRAAHPRAARAGQGGAGATL